MAGHGWSGPGSAWHGMAGQGKGAHSASVFFNLLTARHGWARRGMDGVARRGPAWHGRSLRIRLLQLLKAGLGPAWQGGARLGTAGHGRSSASDFFNGATHGSPPQGWAWRGAPWQGMDGPPKGPA